MNPDENQLDSAYDIFFVRMLKFTHAKKTWFENQTFIRPTSITIEYTPLHCSEDFLFIDRTPKPCYSSSYETSNTTYSD